MAYGVEFQNNDNVVTLDSEFSRLTVMSKGRYVPNQESGLASITNFERVITTQEPPLIFVKPDTVNAVAGLCRSFPIGSPGNWTGFYVRAYDSSSAQPNGRYFAAAFQASPVAQYGFRIWDGSAKLLFDSGTPCANFTKSYQTWTYRSTTQTSQGLYRVAFSVPFDFSTQDYMLLNTFGMNVAGSSLRSANIYCWWDFPGNTLWCITIGATNQNTMYVPVVFARMQV
ncbi:hypothetical protein I7860_30935 [Pseudomonas tolaasii]|uniref:hypothetical protein n=2 Tax=Pseudomonas tolaasii TaxID=29442 RepID=UPI001C58178D|nr:hypothetical protein [Pseudomonas tolaasii]MBW1251083.1 hypothetical protein [Pseudomonas tolaasii]